MPIKKTMRSSWKGIFAVGALCAAGLLAGAPAQAVVSNCTRSPLTWDRSWTGLKPATIVVGTPVARLDVWFTANFTSNAGDKLIVAARHVPGEGYIGSPVNGNPINAPGLALRLTHLRTDYMGGPVFAVPPGGFALGGSAGRTISETDIGVGTYSLRQTWRYELVVTNVAAYTGAAIKASSIASFGIGWASAPPSGIGGAGCAQLYQPSFDIFGTQLAGVPPPPGEEVLPKPPPPTPTTCNFTQETLNQTVALRPAYRDNVAPSGSARSAGQVGEVGFNLVGTGCGAGTALKIFTTDSKNHSNTTSNLTLSTGDINLNRMALRLYHGDSATPLNFGPIPTPGSMGGANYVAVTAPPAGGTVTVPFTAQYVLLPGFNATDLQPGPASAAAFVTIVYP